jgi:hypothetical protein
MPEQPGKNWAGGPYLLGKLPRLADLAQDFSFSEDC